MDPLIVTLEMDPRSRDFFDTVREAHFPPDRLFVGAHVTVFHKLPSDRMDAIVESLAGAALATGPLPFEVAEPFGLSKRGVAYRLDAPKAKSLKGRLVREWDFDLTQQDQGGLRPHVTVQNKVAPEVAAATLDSLRATFEPSKGRFEALALWWYRGGPWEAAGRWDFVGGDP
ncbi:2'-5' RNA ligase family protein [Jannaschia aquimarina]|uniref:2',5' RNA ligase family n=1 Tax=Jannaschia aquimarina TaxID=935700 RepID=A0A0D1EIE9_9RHOB|nr:2'-5' RNA ligase family protein [Jannaschia aquimarina]KIT17374.1 hypothetical protein jaqu_08630 [Jannaschia aquimarina]SNS45636.1 2'-5' RNA ligase superfamily protein [Jannaschia aquimarina]